MKKISYFLFTSFLLFSQLLASQEDNILDIDAFTSEDINLEQIEELIDATNSDSLQESKVEDEQCKEPPCESLTEIRPYTSNRFGYNFIATRPTSNIAVGDLPLPNDYKISFNDSFKVILSGSKKANYNLKVSLDGTILFPEIGSISVVGETFGDVKSKLINIINQSYIGVKLDLSLDSLSAKKITLVGAVNFPGTYLVNPFTTISGALAYSGGVSDIGTLRNIKLIRTNGDVIKFDLYQLLIKGDRKNDITIESGDTLFIGPTQNFIELKGSVLRPGVYEIKDSETLEDLIEFGLGLKEKANTLKISYKLLNKKRQTLEKKETSDLKLSLLNVKEVEVFDTQMGQKSGVLVYGAVKKPGYYDIEKYTDLESLIQSLEFFSVYPWLAVLEQFDSQNLLKETTLFNLRDPKTYNSKRLLPNSRLYFLSLSGWQDYSSGVEDRTSKLIQDLSLRINHKNNIYTLPVVGRFNASSFIDFLGLDMSDVSPEVTYISPTNEFIIRDNYRKINIEAKKYHTLTFRSYVNDLINVNISGAIDFPGNYTLQHDASLQDLYNLVGQFKESANLNGIVLKRQSVRERQLSALERSKRDLNESILSRTQQGLPSMDASLIDSLSLSINPDNLGRIAGNFRPNTDTAKNTTLFNGDVVLIPARNNSISVLGEVLNPTSFILQGNISVTEAISNAGGLKDFADKKGIYVIRANGLIVRENKNIFLNRRIRLSMGDTVIVPRKLATDTPGFEALIPITQILSDMAFTAAALDSLSDD